MAFKTNLDGKSDQKADVKKYNIPVDTYEGVVKDVSDVFQSPRYKAEGTVDKVAIVVELDLKQKSGDTEENVVVPLFATTTVSKGNPAKNMSPSKLFEVIDGAGRLEDYRKTYKLWEAMNEEEANNAAVQWLKDNLVGKRVKVLTKKVKKGTPEEWSAVDKVVKFL